jgi:hypothetical protein
VSVTLPTPKPAPKPEEPAVSRETVVLAQAAQRIMREDVYIRAREGLRRDWLERLAKTRPDDVATITQIQATIRAIDGLDAELLKFTHSAPKSVRVHP